VVGIGGPWVAADGWERAAAYHAILARATVDSIYWVQVGTAIEAMF